MSGSERQESVAKPRRDGSRRSWPWPRRDRTRPRPGIASTGRAADEVAIEIARHIRAELIAGMPAESEIELCVAALHHVTLLPSRESLGLADAGESCCRPECSSDGEMPLGSWDSRGLSRARK